MVRPRLARGTKPEDKKYNMIDGEDFRPVITVVDTAPEPWMTAATVS